mgnify:CR=1 FL=1
MEDNTSPNMINISNGEDNVNSYLAASLKKEIAEKRELRLKNFNSYLATSLKKEIAEKRELRLKNSKSESSVIPDYLTGFRIPKGDSQSSLGSAMVNLNLNNPIEKKNSKGKDGKDGNSKKKGTKQTAAPTLAGTSKGNPCYEPSL